MVKPAEARRCHVASDTYWLLPLPLLITFNRMIWITWGSTLLCDVETPGVHIDPVLALEIYIHVFKQQQKHRKIEKHLKTQKNNYILHGA